MLHMGRANVACVLSDTYVLYIHAVLVYLFDTHIRREDIRLGEMPLGRALVLPGIAIVWYIMILPSAM